MKLIKLNLLKQNRLRIDDAEYFLVNKNNKTFVLPTKCPHRGGPLHYGQVDQQGEFIVCPLHNNKFKLQHLNCKGFASVQIGKHLTLVTNYTEYVAWHDGRLGDALEAAVS